MKKIIYLLAISVLAFSCGEFEDVIYDNTGQTGVGFTQAEANLTVFPTGASTTLTVQSTTTSPTDRSFSVAVNTEESIGTSDNYTIGNVVIPANSYDGALEVTFTDNSLVDDEVYLLVLDLDLPADVAVVGSKTAQITYVKAFICNDLVLTLNEDQWAGERGWEITDDTGTVVSQCSDFTQCPFAGGAGPTAEATYTFNINLPDGCYTFTITDTYGDGQSFPNDGDYSLSCGAIVHASGGSNWGSSESTDFCVNP